MTTDETRKRNEGMETLLPEDSDKVKPSDPSVKMIQTDDVNERARRVRE